MITFNQHVYDNWQTFFRKSFDDSKKYHQFDEQHEGETIIHKYVSFDKTNKTVIKIGFLDSKLIYCNFENPLTPGFTRQQELEHFYRYDFTPEQTYGDPGLEFNIINIQAINHQLMEGLKGKETQYYQGGKLMKSQINIYYKGLDKTFPFIIYFEEEGFVKKVISLLTERIEYKVLTTKEIDLKTVFGGL